MESVTRSKRSDKNAKEKQQGRRKKQRLDVNVASLSESKDSAPKLGKQKSGDDSAEWNRMFFELMLYKANNGNINVKSSDSENSELHKWVLHQRKQYKLFQNDADSSSLTPDRIKVLESVRFAFTTRGEDHWNRNFEKLKEFRKVHGHVLVPRLSEEAGLGDWVINQRLQMKDCIQGKTTALTKTRKELLDELGFVWQVRNRPEWSSKFEELVAYKNKYGDTRVPQHWAENKTLGKWVAKQREQYKLLQKGRHSYLSPDRLEQLKSIGFVWSVKGDNVVKEKSTEAKKENNNDPKNTAAAESANPSTSKSSVRSSIIV